MSDFKFAVRDVRRTFRYRAMRGAVLTPVLGRRWVQEPLGDVTQRMHAV